MDGYKEVGLVAVGNVGTGVQGHEHIGLTGIDDPHVRTVALYQSAEGQRHVQVDVLLLRDGAHGTSIRTSVTRINYQRKFLACSGRYSHKRTCYP